MILFNYVTNFNGEIHEIEMMILKNETYKEKPMYILYSLTEIVDLESHCLKRKVKSFKDSTISLSQDIASQRKLKGFTRS